MTNHDESIIANKKSFFVRNNRVLLIGALIVLVITVIWQFWYIGQLKSHDRLTDAVTQSKGPSMQQTLSSKDSLIDWDPLVEMQRLQHDINSMFRNSLFRGGNRFDMGNMLPRGSFFEPDVDVQEKKDSYIVKIDLPGMEKDKISINVQDNYMMVEGQRQYEKQGQSKDDRYFRAERSFGSFRRMIPLPGEINKEGITADYKKGVLTVIMPKITGGFSKNKGSRIKIA